MNVKKALCALLAATQITAAMGGLPVAYAAQQETAQLEPRMVSAMPVIDGQLGDSVWSMQHAMEKPLQGGTEHSASFDVLWDYQYLYVAVQVENDTDRIAGSAWMEGDVVNLFFDKTNHKSSPYTESDWQIGVGYNPDDAFDPYILFGGGVVASQEAREELSRNILAATSDTDNGWTAEIAVPWDSLGIDPYLQKDFGFDIGVDNKNASHGSGEVDYLLWETNDRTSFWNDTAGFGNMSLSTEVVENTDDGVIYQQNFDDVANGELPEGFAPAEGQETGWSVQDGKLVADFSRSGEIERRIALPALGDHFTYDLDVTFEDAVNTGRWLSAFYRAPQDNGFGYYHFTNRLNGAGEISMKGTDNTWPTAFVNTNGTSEAQALTVGDTYHLSIAALGQNLTHVRTGSKEEERFDHSVNTYEHLGTSRPATMESDLQARGRFGLQVDQMKATFDNLVIRRLDIDTLNVEGLPDSIEQLSVLPEMEISAACSNGATIAVDRKDAKVYSSDPAVLRILEDGTIRSLNTGKATISVIVANRLFTKEIEVTPSDREPAITELHVQDKQSIYTGVVGQSVPVSALKFDAVDELLENQVLSGDSEGMALASSDESVVKIENGQFVGVGEGVATVTATIDGASDSILVWVRADETDDVFMNVDFEDGTLPADWKQIGGGYEIKEEGGNHFLEMQPSTRFIVPMPEGVTDYTIEADMTFMAASDSARWASIMYRIQNEDRPYYQFAVRQDSTATNGVEFAVMTASGSWDVRETASFDEKMEYGATHHLKLTITGERVKQWIDGEELIFTDKATDLTAGDIGLQSNNVTVRFDNLTVRLNPEPLPELPKPENNYAQVKTLNENLVSAPTVIVDSLASLDDADALINDDVTSSVMLKVELEDGELVCYSGETRLGSLADVVGKLYGKLILLLELDDADTANALAAYIDENKLEDLQVASTDRDLLRSFRDQATTTRASLILDQETLTLEDAYEAVGNTNIAKAKNIIIRQSAATKEIVEEMQRRLMSVWVLSDDTVVGQFKAIQSGANGVITGEPEQLGELAEIFTDRTITRRSFIIGHRGTPANAPENTMAGYIMAFEDFGAQMFENDVYLTKDGEVIILHDDTFARTTDILTNTKIPDSVFTNGVTRQNCRPKDLTLDQIKLLDAGSYYGPEFVGEQIPTLREHLEYMIGKDVVMFLELKDASDGIEKACMDLVKEYGLEDQVCAITFNAKSVPIALDEMPTLSLGYLSGVGSVDTNNPMVTVRKALNQVLPMNTTFNPSYGAIHNEMFIEQMQGRGMTLWPWTYNDRSAFDWAIDHGINGLTTNYANWAMDYVFGAEAEQDAYTVNAGESISLKATGETNIHDVVTYDTPEIVVLDGEDCINVSGNTITGLKAGTATVTLRVDSQMNDKTYDLYTAPVTITVEGQLMEGYAPVKTLNENLVSAPTVIADSLASLDDADALINDDVTSSVMLKVELEDGELVCYSGETRLGSLADVVGKLYGKLILLLELDDADTANALAAYIDENKLEDLQVASTDRDLLRSFRDQATTTRASLILDQETLTLEDAYEAVGNTNIAKAKNIIIRQSAATKEIVEEMQRRLMSVWVLSDDTVVGQFKAIQSGANGVITGEPEQLGELAEIFTDRTITRRSFIIGHRGTPANAPENTMAGYIMAFEDFGAQMFENDVYLTKDGEVIILHDDTFARTTDILTNTKIPDSVFTNGVTRENCRPKDLTLEQIKLLDAGSYYGPEFAGEQIPTLREQLEYMQGKDVVLFLELKDNSDGIEKAALDLVKEYGLEDQVCAITFNAKSVPIALEELPTLSLGYLSGVGRVNADNPMETVSKALNQVLPMNTTFNPSYAAIHNEMFVEQMQGRGMTLWPWTYNNRSAFDWAIDHGINGLTTNYANWAMDYVFGAEAEQDAYTVNAGESISLKATGETNIHDVVTYDTPEIVVLDGEDCINVSGNTITGLKAGTATVTLRVDSQMNDKTYDLYTAPVTITVDGEPSEHMLTVTFPNTVELSIGGESQTIANLIGTYKDVVMADDALELTFTPSVEGREIAGVTVNSEAIAEDSFDAAEYVYSAAMPNADTTIELGFTIVDKQNLRAAIEIAEGRANEAAEAVESVQEKYEAALQAAKDVEAKKTATQDEINTAWSDLIDALHYLSFVAGDKSQLEIPMEIAESINRDLFTPDSLKALDEAYAAAEDLLDDEEVLEADITAAVDALYDAIYGLVYRADVTELEALVTKGDGIVANADQYIQNDAWTSFETVLAEAKTVLEDANATQDAVDTAAEDLAAAISALRLIPDKDALEALIGEAEAINTNKYTAKSVATMKAALSTAKAVLNDAEATEEEVADAVEALENSIDGLVEKSTSTSSKGSTSANIGNAYGAAGVVSASQSVAANAYVVSDTTVNFTLKRGSAYCFKMTVVNGNAMTPGFTAGNGDVLKTQFVAKVGNDYYYRVYATGTPGQSTGVYTTLPGQNAVKHCAVTIG